MTGIARPLRAKFLHGWPGFRAYGAWYGPEFRALRDVARGRLRRAQ